MLGAFYFVAASDHARRINTSRARADQSGYLWDAVAIHEGRHGGVDRLIGERNRMPVYPWLLSWLYDPSMSPDGFFEVAKRWNIAGSLVLLTLLAVVLFRTLPPLPAANLLLIVAFGYFVFKAGYAQVELLFYTLWFLMFVVCCRLLTTERPRASLCLAAAGGCLAALVHLSKAAVLPFVGLVLIVLGGSAVRSLIGAVRTTNANDRRIAMRAFSWRAAVPVVFAAVFLGILWPYLANSKRVFGQYFYNVNQTFYVWYDDWPSASVGTYKHGDGVGWPTLPRHEIPSMRKYLREHSAGQIAARVADGLAEMVTVSYTRLWYFKFVAAYLFFGAVLVVTCRSAVASTIRSHAALSVFLLLYGVIYLAAVAFYKPISGTTLRMLLTHVLPLLYILSRLCTTPPFVGARWSVAGTVVTPGHFQLAVIWTMGLDLVFVLWPRLMSEFAGY